MVCWQMGIAGIPRMCNAAKDTLLKFWSNLVYLLNKLRMQIIVFVLLKCHVRTDSEREFLNVLG